MVAVSPSTGNALNHLKSIKPLDGWSVESGSGGIRLLRRSVPLTNNYFLDLHHDKDTGFVVGILSCNSGNSAQAQVLVDKSGIPVGGRGANSNVQLIGISTYNPNRSGNSNSNNRTTTTSRSSSSNNATTAPISDEENKKLLQMGLFAICGLIILKILSSALFSLYILALPCIFFYGIQTCPSNESFDAKKELKRVLRGHHLPEDHPDKPKGWLSETVAKLSATVTTELATSLGYEVSLTDFLGAAKLAAVRVPTSKMDFYWIGAIGKWHYVYASKYEDD